MLDEGRVVVAGQRRLRATAVAALEQRGDALRLDRLQIVENRRARHPDGLRNLRGAQLVLRAQPQHEQAPPRPFRLRSLPRRRQCRHSLLAQASQDSRHAVSQHEIRRLV